MGRLRDKSTELSIISYQIQDELAHAVFLLAWHCVCVCVCFELWCLRYMTGSQLDRFWIVLVG